MTMRQSYAPMGTKIHGRYSAGRKGVGAVMFRARGGRPEEKLYKPSWTHPICHTELHVFKSGTEEGDRCYCKRRRMTTKKSNKFFIEARRY